MRVLININDDHYYKLLEEKDLPNRIDLEKAITNGKPISDSTKICEECLKEISPKDQPYKCFGRGMRVGRKDVEARNKSLENKIRELETKVDKLTAEGNKLRLLLGNKILSEAAE